MKKRIKKTSLIALFWLLAWQAIAMTINSPLLLPGPLDTARALFDMLADGGFYMDALATIGRCLAAMILALVLGAVLSVAAYRWQVLRDILSLPVALFKTIPIMAVAIYMILLMSAGSVPVLVCWIMCFPIVYTNMLAGLDAMDGKLLEMARVYGIGGFKLIRYLYLPMLYPHFRSAMSLVAGMSWKAIVTAEVLSIPRLSLGYELMNAKYYLNTDILFAYVVVLIVISILFERLIKRLVAMLEPHSYEYSKIMKTDVHTDNMKFSDASKELCNGTEPLTVQLVNVRKSYGEKRVLEDLNMQLEPGTITALMGASGSGKTTIARLIAGLEQPDEGSIRINCSDAQSGNSDSHKISYLFQEDRLLPWLNVYDNLAIVRADEIAIYRMLEAVGLDEEAWKLPGELSGGMSYRVAMARAFLIDSGLLIADEPFRGLDATTRNTVLKKLWIPGTMNRTVLLITHSEEDKKLAEQVVTIE